MYYLFSVTKMVIQLHYQRYLMAELVLACGSKGQESAGKIGSRHNGRSRSLRDHIFTNMKQRELGMEEIMSSQSLFPLTHFILNFYKQYQQLGNKCSNAQAHGVPCSFKQPQESSAASVHVRAHN